jgi:integrase
MKLTLPSTDRGITAIRPDAKRLTYWDALVPGLALRVSSEGRKTFVVIRRARGGKLAYHTIGTYPSPYSLAVARGRAREALLTLADGRPIRGEEPTFRDVAAEYVKRHVRRELRSPKDRKEVEDRIERELVSRWGHRPISDIRRTDITGMVDEIIDAGGADPAPGRRRRRGGPNAARHALSTARALFNWAVERGTITGSPVVIRAKTAHGRAPRRDRVLTDGELRAIWRAAEEAGYPHGSIIRVLMLTGQRVNEVARARWSEVDLDSALLTVPPDRMKVDGAGHTVPLSPLVVTILRETCQCHPVYIFSKTRGRPFSGFSKAKVALDRRLELPHWTLQDIRRTVRTRLTGIGVPREVAEEVVAHKKQGIVKVYDLHRFDAEKRAALQAWSARLSDIVA